MAGRKRIVKAVGKARVKAKEKMEFLDLSAELKVDKAFENVITDGYEKFIKEFMSLEGRDYVDRYLAVVEYIKPKLSKVDKNAGSEQGITLNFITSGSEQGVKLLESKKKEAEDSNLIFIEEGISEEV